MELRAARAVSLVALMVEFHCGSSVEDYEPVYEMAARLCLPTTLSLSVTLAANRPSEELSLVQQTLRLLTAILAGHGRAVGRRALPMAATTLHLHLWILQMKQICSPACLNNLHFFL